MNEPAAPSFVPFTLAHLLAAGICVSAITISCILGRRWRDAAPELERRLAFGWGGFLICVNLWSITYWLLPGTFNLRQSLPLQLCDLAALASPLVYLTSLRWPRVLIYFWGIGLSTQAFITPTLVQGPEHMRFWLFWLLHLAIVGSAVYDVAVLRYRPSWRDLGLVSAATLLWALAMIALNIRLGSNYGYVGNTTPDNPTLIDALGPWPGRLFILAAIVLTLFTLMRAIWLIPGLAPRSPRATSST